MVCQGFDLVLTFYDRKYQSMYIQSALADGGFRRGRRSLDSKRSIFVVLQNDLINYFTMLFQNQCNTMRTFQQQQNVWYLLINRVMKAMCGGYAEVIFATCNFSDCVIFIEPVSIDNLNFVAAKVLIQMRKFQKGLN